MHIGCFGFRAIGIMTQLKCETCSVPLQPLTKIFTGDSVIAYKILTPQESLETVEGHFNAGNKNYLVHCLEILRMTFKSLTVQSHAHAYTVLGTQAKGNRELQNHCLSDRCICSHPEVIFQEVNSNICQLHSDFRLLFISILGFAFIYIPDFHLPIEKGLVCSTFSQLLIGLEVLSLKSL